MILVDLHLQVIVCKVCGEELEIERRLLRDQHELLVLKDQVTKDHRKCAASPNDMAKAIRDRAFRKRVERELAKTEGRGRGPRPRCQGDRQASALHRPPTHRG